MFTTDYTEDHFGRVLQNPIESQRVPQDFTFSFMDIPKKMIPLCANLCNLWWTVTQHSFQKPFTPCQTAFASLGSPFRTKHRLSLGATISIW